jgi:4-hydroxybenzoate polyprenyltransferase
MLAIVEDLEDRAVDEGYIKTIPLYLKKSETEVLIVLWLFSYLALSSRIDLFSERLDIKILSIVLTVAPLIYFIYLKKSPKINHRYFDFILFLIGLLHLLVQNKVYS